MCPFKKAFPFVLLMHLLFVAGIFSAWAGHKSDATFTLAPAVGEGEAMSLSVVRVGGPDTQACVQPKFELVQVEGLEPATSESPLSPAKISEHSDRNSHAVRLRAPATCSGVAGTPGENERLGGAAAGEAGGKITPPVVISRPKPQRVESVPSGSVEVFFIIDETGRVQNPCIGQSSSPYLSAAVLKVLPQWRFVPAKKDGQTFAMQVRQVVEF
jgi:TonB family protein